MITVTTLGANSATLTYDNTTTLLELIQEVEDYITTHGWSLWDINAGTNARAYRALNQDGETYGYIVLDYNTTGYLIARVYESWNADTHTGTNKAHNTSAWDVSQGYLSRTLNTVAESVLSQRVDLTNGGSITLYCKSSYLILLSSVPAGVGNVNANCPTMLLEYARDNAEDTPLLNVPPRFLFLIDNIRQTNSKSYAGHGYALSFCRLVTDAVGAEASKKSWFALPEMHTKSGRCLDTAYIGQEYFWTPALNAWSNKYMCSNIFVGYGGGINDELLIIPNGRVYGLKAISADQGANNDIVKIEIDANGFYKPGGTLTDHYILKGAFYSPAYTPRFAVEA